MSITTITKENFSTEVLQETRPIFIDFWAEWCAPCKIFSPVIGEIAQEHQEIKVAKVNIDNEPELVAQFNVMSIPTVILMKNGEITDTRVGVRPKADILSMLQA